MRLFDYRPADQVERQRKLYESAITELKAAEGAYAATRSEIDPDDPDGRTKVKKSLQAIDEASLGVRTQKAILEAAENAYASALESAKIKAENAQWEKCEDIATRRRRLADDVTKSVGSLIRTVTALLDSGLELYEATPKSPGTLMPEVPLAPPRVQDFVRLEFARLGWRWMSPGIGMMDEDKVPTLAANVDWGNDWAFRLRSPSNEPHLGDSPT